MFGRVADKDISGLGAWSSAGLSLGRVMDVTDRALHDRSSRSMIHLLWEEGFAGAEIGHCVKKKNSVLVIQPWRL